jgi:hypothetical protein
MKNEPNKTEPLDPNVSARWRKALKKKNLDDINPLIRQPKVFNPAGGPSKYPDPASTCPSPSHSNKISPRFDKFFSSLDDVEAISDNTVWKIVFPKIAEDLLDPEAFIPNVISAVSIFGRTNLPIKVKVGPKTTFSVDKLHVQVHGEHYPTINFMPLIKGPKTDLDEFLKSIHEHNGYELHWRGSFRKNKTTGKIIGMNLTGLVYYVPDKFIAGQPISYDEKVLV